MKHARSDYNSRIVDLEHKIPENEPVFLLRGQDKLAPRLLLMWAMELRLQGGDPSMAEEAERHAQLMIEWQKTHKVKTPDQYNDSPERQFILGKLNTLIEEVKSGLYTGNAKDIINWLTKYYGDTKGLYYILMPSDLKPESKFKPVNQLVFDDFKVIDEDTLEMMKAKLILFCSNKDIIILKCDIR